jgi:hypothetical protein
MNLFFGGLAFGAVVSIILVGVVWLNESGDSRLSTIYGIGLYLLLPGLFILSLFVAGDATTVIPGAFIAPILLVTLCWRKLKEIRLTQQASKDAEAAAVIAADARLSPAELKKVNKQRAAVASARIQKRKLENAELTAKVNYGTLFPKVICPHCQTAGSVRKATRTRVTTTQSDSSLIGKIISPKARSETAVSELHCENCDLTWNA